MPSLKLHDTLDVWLYRSTSKRLNIAIATILTGVVTAVLSVVAYFIFKNDGLSIGMVAVGAVVTLVGFRKLFNGAKIHNSIFKEDKYYS